MVMVEIMRDLSLVKLEVMNINHSEVALENGELPEDQVEAR